MNYFHELLIVILKKFYLTIFFPPRIMYFLCIAPLTGRQKFSSARVLCKKYNPRPAFCIQILTLRERILSKLVIKVENTQRERRKDRWTNRERGREREKEFHIRGIKPSKWSARWMDQDGNSNIAIRHHMMASEPKRMKWQDDDGRAIVMCWCTHAHTGARARMYIFISRKTSRKIPSRNFWRGINGWPNGWLFWRRIDIFERTFYG